jgi:drug/metabolite transporter (DMT)-like permease
MPSGSTRSGARSSPSSPRCSTPSSSSDFAIRTTSRPRRRDRSWTFGALIAILAIGLVGPGIEFGFSWPSHGWLLALATGSQVVGWLAIGYALPRLPAVETATIILLQPALTMLWGTLIFDERPSALQIVGAVIVLTGVAFVAGVRARRVPAVP